MLVLSLLLVVTLLSLLRMAQMLGFRDLLQPLGVAEKVSPPPATDDEGSDLNLGLGLSLGGACASHSENKDDCSASLVVESRDKMMPQQKRKELQALSRQKARKKLDVKHKLQRGHCRGSSVSPCARLRSCNAVVGFCVGKDDRRALESQMASVRQRERRANEEYQCCSERLQRKAMMPQRHKEKEQDVPEKGEGGGEGKEEEERSDKSSRTSNNEASEETNYNNNNNRKINNDNFVAASSATFPILPIAYPYPPPPIPLPMGFSIRYMMPFLAPTEPFNAAAPSPAFPVFRVAAPPQPTTGDSNAPLLSRKSISSALSDTESLSSQETSYKDSSSNMQQKSAVEGEEREQTEKSESSGAEKGEVEEEENTKKTTTKKSSDERKDGGGLGLACVTTKGERRVSGYLKNCTTKGDVSIVCLCHGQVFSPAEFIRHAGGTEVSHPERHIFVNLNSSSAS